VQGHAVHDVGHAEFAHAVGDVVARGLAADVRTARPVGQVGAGEVGGAAEELGQRRRQRVDGDLRGLARGHGFGLGVDRVDGLLGDRTPLRRQLAGHAALEFGGLDREGLGVVRELLVPVGFPGGALLLGVPGFVHLARHLEGAEGPVHQAAGGGDLGVAQRRAVHVVGAGLVRRTGADHGLAADQRGLVGHRLGGFDGGMQRLGVVAVDVGHDVPAVGLETLGRVVGEPAFDVAVDGDAVVVPEGSQLAQPPGAGERTGFVGDTFHQAAVAEEDPGAVIDDGVAGLVELVGQQLLGHGHAHGVGDALTERAGGGFDAGGVAQLGVARRLAVQLAEVLQIVDGQIVAGEVQQGVDQHRAVAVGEHETVAVGPVRVGRVVAQVVVPQHLGDLGHAHGRAGMAGIGLLHGVHGQGADGAGQLVEHGFLEVAESGSGHPYSLGVRPGESRQLSAKPGRVG